MRKPNQTPNLNISKAYIQTAILWIESAFYLKPTGLSFFRRQFGGQRKEVLFAGGDG